MKIALCILAATLMCLAGARAQVVTVGLSLDQDQFLPGESLPVTVLVTNNSGQTLHLGADPKWLLFDVEALDNQFVVMKNSDPQVVGAFTLGSSERAKKKVDLAPHFVMSRAGSYRIVATVHIPEWGTDVVSPPAQFDVIDGAWLWSQDFGLPVPAGATNQPPVVRKYILEEANYLKQQLRMYVLVSDQSGRHILKVSAIGPMVSFSRPEVQLDAASNLHVIYQSGGQSFIYSVVNPDGAITKQEIYDIFNASRPRLAPGADGGVVVQGGVRRVRPSALPAVNSPVEMPPLSSGKQP